MLQSRSRLNSNTSVLRKTRTETLALALKVKRKSTVRISDSLIMPLWKLAESWSLMQSNSISKFQQSQQFLPKPLSKTYLLKTPREISGFFYVKTDRNYLPRQLEINAALCHDSLFECMFHVLDSTNGIRNIDQFLWRITPG